MALGSSMVDIIPSMSISLGYSSIDSAACIASHGPLSNMYIVQSGYVVTGIASSLLLT